MSGRTTKLEERRIELSDTEATGRFAAALAAAAARGDVFALDGDLGSGKTAFARAFIHALAARAGEDPGEVPSPTFTLVQTYALAAGTVYHFDLYRLVDPDEATELGMEDAFADGIALIEWPERLAGRLPDDRLQLHFEYGADAESRVVSLVPFGSWRERLAGLDLQGGQ